VGPRPHVAVWLRKEPRTSYHSRTRRSVHICTCIIRDRSSTSCWTSTRSTSKLDEVAQVHLDEHLLEGLLLQKVDVRLAADRVVELRGEPGGGRGQEGDVYVDEVGARERRQDVVHHRDEGGAEARVMHRLGAELDIGGEGGERE